MLERSVLVTGLIVLFLYHHLMSLLHVLHIQTNIRNRFLYYKQDQQNRMLDYHKPHPPPQQCYSKLVVSHHDQPQVSDDARHHHELQDDLPDPDIFCRERVRPLDQPRILVSVHFSFTKDSY